jgi:hypothetical protein
MMGGVQNTWKELVDDQHYPSQLTTTNKHSLKHRLDYMIYIFTSTTEMQRLKICTNY